MVKHTVKSLKRDNKFHTYLTRETLPAEERVSKFHNHGETSSCQILADAAIVQYPREHPERFIESNSENSWFEYLTNMTQRKIPWKLFKRNIS